MKIGIANDHRGLNLKNEILQHLKTKYEIIDYGTNTHDSVDYPDYGIILGEAVRDSKVSYGIAICGSAIGISIAANKVKGVRCGKINTKEEAIHGKEKDFINIIAISGDTMSKIDALDIIETFINTANSKENRYSRRKEIIERYENGR